MPGSLYNVYLCKEVDRKKRRCVQIVPSPTCSNLHCIFSSTIAQASSQLALAIKRDQKQAMPQGWGDTAGIWVAQRPMSAIFERDDGGLVEISTYLRRTAVPRPRIFSPEIRDRNGKFCHLQTRFAVMEPPQKLLHKDFVIADGLEIAV